MEEQARQIVEIDRNQIQMLAQPVQAAQRAMRRSIGRALAFVFPGLGHAFHGATFWAIGYAVSFVFCLNRAWAAYIDPYPSYIPSDVPSHIGWAIAAVGIWIGQIFHVDFMDISD